MKKYTLDYFGSFPREALLIVFYMIAKWPGVRLFSVDELSSVTSMGGRALSGSLSSFSKRSGRSLIVKAGTTDRTKDGGKYGRPKQLWALNPELSGSEIQEMRVKVNQLVGLDRPIRICSGDESGWNGLESGFAVSGSNVGWSSTSAEVGKLININ